MPITNKVEFDNGDVYSIQHDVIQFLSYLRQIGGFFCGYYGFLYKATRALYEVLTLGRMYKLKIKCQLDLFDKMVKPILLYGCEVWGFGDNDIIERAHLQFCKLLLNLKTSTPSYMVYDELSRYPIEIDIKLSIISYWTK